jgi:hypothetical protein
VGTLESTEPIISVAAVVAFGIIIGFESYLWNIVLLILIDRIVLSPVAAYVYSKTLRRLPRILVKSGIAVLNIRRLTIVFP